MKLIDKAKKEIWFWSCARISFQMSGNFNVMILKRTRNFLTKKSLALSLGRLQTKGTEPNSMFLPKWKKCVQNKVHNSPLYPL